MTSKQRLIVVGSLGVLALIGVWAAAARDRKPTSDAALRANRTAATGSMADMPGMNMGSDGSVQVTAAQIRQFGITFGFVEERTMSSTLRATGAIVTPENRIVTVTTKVSGYVERLFVNSTGVPVSRGQPLFELYSPEIVAAQEELLLARRSDRVIGGSAVPGIPNASSDLLGSARRRLALLDVPEALIDDVLRTGRVHRTMTVFAPASGVVTEKAVVQGQGVNAGMMLFTLADLSAVWVEVEVREGDAGSLRAGQGVDVEVTGLPGRAFKGRIELIQPTVDAAARTVRARVAVSNPGMLLKPGMYATVNVLIPSRRTLTVPASAVISTGTRSLVFVDMGGGRLMPHDVEIGAATGEYTEVLSGLEPGQRVVTSAQFLLESESNIAEVMKSMMGQTGSSDMKMSMPPASTEPATKGPPTKGRR
jgi:Cu(I)/Ag(I) efflux system membrane fusion protein/cobalt-zinc-cadmium efflux system membrane fusion protein